MRAVPCMRKCSFFLPWLLATALFLHTAVITVVAYTHPTRKVYIVYMGERKHSDVERITKSHHEMLASVLGSQEAALYSMIYSYRHGFSGFAAKMTESQAKYCQGLPGVVGVFRNHIYKTQTTRSFDFLGLDASSTTNLMHDTNQGDGMIIGVIDSGIWPESRSFFDTGLDPIPDRWKGSCQPGEEFVPSEHCNRKLIGAQYFIDGYIAENGPYNPADDNDYLSPRDGDGHGTHCASIAAGSLVNNVNFNGLARGTARGAAPRARLAVYKVMWLGSATSADILKAFDQAIHDGVDVLSASIGSPLPEFPEILSEKPVNYAAYHAVAREIVVVTAGGNDGPKYQAITNVAPWIINVAASTLDRAFYTPITLGNNRIYAAQGMFVGRDTGFVELVSSPKHCEQLTEDDDWVAEKMVLCFTVYGDEGHIVEAADTVIDNGGLGLIATRKYITSAATYRNTDDYPRCILVTYDVASQILNYILFTGNPTIRVRPTWTFIGDEATTYIAYFSSRGPNSLAPAVLKPDIAAPGVDILAATIPRLENTNGYALESGTSMACPHVAGIVAMLKSLNPTWSPAAILSALVTTAWTTDPFSGEPIYAQEDTPKIADPFDYGGGLVNPNAARNPGLVFDMGTQDYINYLCAMGYPEADVDELTGQSGSCSTPGISLQNLNLPSITLNLGRNDRVTVTRTVKNVGDTDSSYEVEINAPTRFDVSVNPTSLEFNSNITRQTFSVSIRTSHQVTTEYYFGSLTWTNKDHQVRIPLSLRTQIPH